MNENFSFTKEHTGMIKGIAILLMLFHHLFGFPNWYVNGISYIGLPLRFNTAEFVIGQFGHICVSLFAFLTGYGMFFSLKSGNIVKKSAKKLLSFLTAYWLILFGISIPLNLALGKTDITLSLILKNMVSYDCSLVPFAWYVRFYIEIILTIPIFFRMMSKKPWITLLFFLIFPPVINIFLGKVPGINPLVIKLVPMLMEYFLWLPCVLTGLCFAKYGFFEKMGKFLRKTKKARLPLLFLALLAVFYLRAYKQDTIGVIFSFDCFYAPIFIFICCEILSYFPNFPKKALSLLGKHSMNI